MAREGEDDADVEAVGGLVGEEGGEEVGEQVLVVAALDEGVEADQEEDEALLWRRLAAVVELQRFDEVGHDFRGFLC